MAAERKIVAHFGMDAAQAKQELAELREAEVQFIAQGNNLATSLSTNLERVQDDVAKAFKKLNDGNSVSQSELDKLIRKFAATREAVEATGVPIEQLPAEFRNAFEVATTQLNALAGGIAAQAESTRRAKDELLAAAEASRKLAELQAEATDKYGDTAEAIDEIRSKSDTTYKEQQEALEKLRDKLIDAERGYKKLGDEGADALKAVRAEAKRVEDALSQVSAAGADDLGKVRDQTLRTTRAFADLEKQIAENPKEAAEAFPKVVGQVVNLRNAIERVQATGGPVDERAMAQLEEFERRLKSSGQEVARVRQQIDQGMASSGAQSSAQWTGLNTEIEKGIGKMGKFGTASLGAFAAFKEGLEIGSGIAEKFGTDFTALERTLGRVKERGAAVQFVINDIVSGWLAGVDSNMKLSAALDLTAQGFEGYQRAIEAGIEDVNKYTEDNALLAGVQDRVAKLSADQAVGVELLHKAQREGAGVMSEWSLSLELAGKIQEAHTLLVSKGAEGQALWNTIYGDGKKSLIDMLLAIDQNAEAIKKLAGVTAEEVEAQKELAEALNNTHAARERSLEMEKEQAAIVAQQEKVEDGLTASLRTKLAEISASMVVKEGREIPLTKLQIEQLEELLAIGPPLSDAERKYLGVLIEKLKTVEQMTQWQRESLSQEIQRKLQVNSSAQADEEHRAVLDKKARTITNAAAETGKLTADQIKLRQSTDESIGPTEKLKGGFGKLADEVKRVESGLVGAGKGLSDFAKNVPDLEASLDRVKQKLSETNSEAIKLKDSMAAIAKGGDS